MQKSKTAIGGHPWVYAASQPGYDPYPVLDQVFADMSAAGLDGIELMSLSLRRDGAVERITELSKRHSLPVIGASFGGKMWDRAAHAEVLADAELCIPRLAELGGKTLGTSVGGAPGLKTPEQHDAQAELLVKLIALCESHGITPNLHNHTYEVKDDLHDLRGTLERVPQAKLGPDLNWLLRGGVDPVSFIRTYGDKIVFLHLRDQDAGGRWSESVGEGAMDYAAIGDALREIRFSGPMAIELAYDKDFQPTRPLRESLRLSREYLRATMRISDS